MLGLDEPHFLAFAARTGDDRLQRVALRTEVERVPVPVERPKALRQKGTPCTKGSFSCEWPRLSESLNDIKKLFSPTPSKPAKKG